MIQSKDEILKEYIKCKLDPIYFINNKLKRQSLGSQQFNLYQKQIELINAIMNYHTVVCLKPRQIGGSTAIYGFIDWYLTFFAGVTVGIVSKDGPASTKFAVSCRTILEQLEEPYKIKFDKHAEQSFVLPNGSKLIASQVNASEPEGLFRGESITLIVLDEAAYIRKIDKAFKGLAHTYATISKQAEEKNIPYGIIALSTPNGTQGLGKWFYDLWKNSIATKDSKFKPIMIKREDVPFADDKWYKDQVEIIKATIPDWELAIEQEINLKFITSEDSLFDSKISSILQDNSNLYCKQCQKEEKTYFNNLGILTGSGTWRRFEEPNDNNFYLIGIDISSSYSSCNSAIQVFKYPELIQVEEFVGKLHISDLKKEIINTSNKYNNCLVIPESNSYGTQLVQELEEEITDKLYMTKKLDINGKVDRLIPGINTNTKTKPLMIESLYWMIKNHPNRIKSDALIIELLSLDKNLKGGLSDLTMAAAFCAYVAKNDAEELSIYQPLNNNKNNSFLNKMFIDDKDNNDPSIINIKLDKYNNNNKEKNIFDNIFLDDENNKDKFIKFKLF